MDVSIQHMKDVACRLFSSFSQETLHAINYHDNMLLLCICFTEEKDTTELYNKLYVSLNQYVQSFDCYTLSIGVSDSCPVENLSQAMRQAKRLLQARIVCDGNSRLITTKQTPPSMAAAGSISEKSLLELQHAVSVLQFEPSRQLIQNMFASLRAISCKDYAAYWNLAGAVIKTVTKALESILPGGQQITEYEDAQYLNLYASNATSISELEDNLLFAAEKLMAQYRESKQQQDSQPIRAAKEFVSVNLSGTLTLSEVAAHVGLSPSYFSVLFKQATGENFKDYVTACRLERAKELLRMTNDTVAAIAQNVGYMDKRYFSQQFEKYVGLKPAKYRKLYS